MGSEEGRIEVVRADPFATPPAFEGLVGSIEGLYTRRISLQHRFVYTVDATPVAFDGEQFQGTVKVVRMWTHYEGIR
ncbi:type II toxin-antitoxin system YoeB family toxin [Candidatus Collinsella stercoripullorum]|uniref:type II toxin-antitoxin system YoeB family toxin n=1 Tax=Candidatus Collinsella stercoripullorum TaxID=2838522 RepID=UPI0022E14CFE|nr:type II toxin-antitoxin system YoeB family toxin [Candidatus Collinsella stercoripullorum]